MPCLADEQRIAGVAAALVLAVRLADRVGRVARLCFANLGSRCRGHTSSGSATETSSR